MFGKPAVADPGVRYVVVDKPSAPSGPIARMKASIGQAVRSGLAWAAAAPFLGLAWLVRQTFSSRWPIFAPVWVPLLVGASVLFPWADAAWAAVVVLVVVVAKWRPGKVLSQREWLLCAAVGVLALVWLHTRAGMDWRGQVVTLLVGAYGPALPWWWWRRGRWSHRTPRFLIRWQEEVVPKVPDAAGEWVEWDDDKGSGILELDDCLASKFVRLDEQVELALGNVYRGAVTLGLDPTLPVKQVRVVLSANPRAQISRITYFDNPTLDDQGRFLLGLTRDGRPVHGRFWRPGGGAFVVITGGPGSGKGGTMRTFGIEAALSPQIWMPVFDCKGVEEGGAGVPELATAADLYLKTKEEWRIGGVSMLHELMGARGTRYGRAGLSRWQRSDPLIFPLIDELARLAKVLSSRQTGQMEEYSALARSFGFGGAYDSQRGDGQSLISPLFRSNTLGGGMGLVGMPGDTISRTLASQDWDVDASKLPAQAGWMLPLSKIDPDVPAEAIRIRYLPSQQEVDEDGVEAPFGTAEQWGSGPFVQRAQLHEEDAEIVAKWRRELGLDEQPASAAPVVEVAATRPVEVRPVVEVSSGVLVEAPAQRHLTVVSDGLPARVRIVQLLQALPAGESRQVSVIAREVGVSKRHAQDLLSQMDGREVVNVGGAWRAAS